MLGILSRLVRRSHDQQSLPSVVAGRLYRSIVAQARLPVFYAELAVPDTPDGRYDLIVLHAILVLRRLHADPTIDQSVGQALFDQMFSEFDESLREMGVGDLRVGKVVKALARGLYGRLAAYGASLDIGDTDALEAALRRNVYRRSAPDREVVAALAAYVVAAERKLAHIDSGVLTDPSAGLPWPAASADKLG